MAKLSVVLRNKKRIRMAAHFEPIRQELRKKAISTTISEEERDAARIKLQTLPRNGSKTRIRNRCLATGRSRGIYRKFMLSRICFREMAHQGLVPGVTKASW